MSVAVDLDLTPGPRRGPRARARAQPRAAAPHVHRRLRDARVGLPQAARERAVVPARVGRAGPARGPLVVPRAFARARRSGCSSASTPTPTRTWPRSWAATGSPRSRGCRPFAGGAVGLFGYDLVRSAEPSVGEPEPRRDRHPRPRADDHRPAGGLRPPAPRGDRAGQRVRRGRPGARPTRPRRRDRRGAREARRPGARGSGAAASEPPEFFSNLGPRRLRRRRRAGDRVHPRRRRLPGGPVAALDRELPGRGLLDLPRPARDQPQPVHVLPRLRGLPDRGRLAGVAREGGRPARGAAPDRRHAPAQRLRPRAGGRAARPTPRSAPST